MYSQNTIKVAEYLREVDSDVTTADIAEALGMEKKSVEGIVTAGLQRKNLSVRVPAEIELEDGTHKQVKFVKLTDLGKTIDFEAANAEEAAQKEAEKAAKAEAKRLAKEAKDAE